MKISFTIPGRPVPKQAARIGKHGGYQPQRIVEYCNKVRYHCAQAIENGLWRKTDQPVYVSLDFGFSWPQSANKKTRITEQPRVKRPDLDNLCKAVLDGCEDLWFDDAQVAMLQTTKINCPAVDEGVLVVVSTTGE